MFDRRRLFWIAPALFVLFALVQFPARLAFAWFAPPGVGGFGFAGTIWNGSARIISVDGLQLRNTEWELAVPWLLTGRLAGDFRTRWSGGFAEGFASIGFGGTVTLRDTQASVELSLVDSLLGLPSLAGQLTADIAVLELADGWPHRFVGTGEIRSLSSPLMGEAGADLIGDVGFDFDTATETESDTVTGRLRDTGGPLELDGRIRLTPPGEYELEARVRARESAPPSLRNNLNYLGPPEPDGTHEFRMAGSI